ncbi:MAG: hypothetical protein HPY57_14150 [Ignavibacteria bacterium]|nr:hypothetical protein [Ignavibacteria bacterium]
MKYLRTYEDWNSIMEPSHHTEDWFKDYFVESDFLEILLIDFGNIQKIN